MKISKKSYIKVNTNMPLAWVEEILPSGVSYDEAKANFRNFDSFVLMLTSCLTQDQAVEFALWCTRQAMINAGLPQFGNVTLASLNVAMQVAESHSNYVDYQSKNPNHGYSRALIAADHLLTILNSSRRPEYLLCAYHAAYASRTDDLRQQQITWLENIIFKA